MGKFIDKKGALRINLKPLQISRMNKAGRVSSLAFSTRNGYPKLIAYINSGDRGVTGPDNNIQASFTYYNFNLLLGSLAAVIDSANGTEYTISTYNTKYVDNQKTDDITIECTILVGKDEEGIIYITMVDRDETKPKMRFNLVAEDRWIKLFNGGLDVTVKAMASKIFAKAYVNNLTTVFSIIFAEEEALKELPSQND